MPLPSPIQRVLIVSNSASGRGMGAGIIARATTTLQRAGVTTRVLPVDRADRVGFQARFRQELLHADALVLAGGDGTVHYSLPVIADTAASTPIYHLPLGTENLFARQFGMTRDADQLLRALRVNHTMPIDMGLLHSADEPTPTPFVLMCSIGPDAGVIRRLHAARTGNINHLSYIRPIVGEILSPSLPELSVEADGVSIVDHQRGTLLVANSAQYAMRMNPAPDARVDDGLLDVVFFPATSGPAAALWMARARVGAHLDHPALIATRAKSVRIHAEPGACIHQLDGELGGRSHCASELNITIQPAALRVLLPGD